MTEPQTSDFPTPFTFGVATSAYQIEGAASEDGKGPSIWDTFVREPGRVRGGDTGDVACDHYHRLPGDLDLIRSLNVDAYRFSVSWPRVLPTGRGAVNAAGLDFYDRLVDGLLARGVTPWATLYHWDLPQALQDAGGWGVRATAEAFVAYSAVVAGRLGDRVRHWITHNEPWVVAHLGHAEGIHAPGLRDFGLSLRVVHHLLLSHGLAVPVIRQAAPGARVGITLNLAQTYPASDSAADRAAAQRSDGFASRWYLDPLYGRGYPQDMLELYGPLAPGAQGVVQPGDLEAMAVPTDFLGINMYSRTVVQDAPGENLLNTRQVRPEGSEYTAFDWEVWPQSLTDLLTRLHRDYAPPALVVTENGAAYQDAPDAQGVVQDGERTRYVQRHLAALAEAGRQGAPVAGYFAWSLMDNFEWAEGYDKRFGIVQVDFQTQARRLKQSGAWYRDFLAGRLVGAP